METNTKRTRNARSASRFLTIIILCIVTVQTSLTLTVAAPPSAPVGMGKSATLPATTCPLVSGIRTCNVWAKTGTLTLPGAVTVPIWGYSTTAGGAATLPGPILIVNQGEPVNVILHNVNLPSATSLTFPGQARVPDTTGVGAGASRTYSFTASDLRPGTYLYEAGLTANGQIQVAMGLFGVLIVRPTGCTNCAYNASTAYDDEAVFVLSEIDPAFNAAPTTFNMRNFAPKYWLINGRAFPDTDAINTLAGNRVLLRYANAGVTQHSMGVLGLRQTVLANDGGLLSYSYQAVAETIPAGATLDAVTTIPGTVPSGTRFALYETANHLDNNGTRTGNIINFGGMLTFLTIQATLPTPTPTNTPLPPTNTPTNTPVPPTNTPVPPTNTPIPPANTPTNTPVPPTFTPTTIPNQIFANDFESGNLSAWSSSVNSPSRITVTTTAAISSTFGMRALISGGTSGYVQNNSPSNETSYRARFYFHPNSTTMGGGGHNIFVGLDSANQNVFQVQVRLNNGNYQIRAIVSRAGGTTNTNWHTITNAYHSIEIAWQSATSTTFRLYTDGTLRQTLTGLNTSGFTLDTVRLGPPAGGLGGGTSGAEYFDNFVSTRTGYIGP